MECFRVRLQIEGIQMMCYDRKKYLGSGEDMQEALNDVTSENVTIFRERKRLS